MKNVIDLNKELTPEEYNRFCDRAEKKSSSLDQRVAEFLFSERNEINTCVPIVTAFAGNKQEATR